MLLDFDQIDLLQAQSRHMHVLSWKKLFLDKPVIKDLSVFKQFCIYLHCAQQQQQQQQLCLYCSILL